MALFDVTPSDTLVIFDDGLADIVEEIRITDVAYAEASPFTRAKGTIDIFLVKPASQPLLNIVLTGNSVMRGEGASAGHQPSDKIATLRPTATVQNSAVNGQDILYYIANFSTQVQAYFNAARFNIVVLLETLDYVDDTLGAAGSGLSLSNPTAAGQDNYDQHVTWANLATSNGWHPVVCCAPDAVEPSSYADAAANTAYRTARDHSYDLMRADSTHFYRVIDLRSRSEFSSPWSTTYYQNAGLGERIHLTDTGYDLEGTIISAGLD